MVKVMKITATSFNGSHAWTAAVCPDPVAGHCQPMPLMETPEHTGKSGSVFCGVAAPFSWVLVHT